MIQISTEMIALLAVKNGGESMGMGMEANGDERNGITKAIMAWHAMACPIQRKSNANIN